MKARTIIKNFIDYQGEEKCVEDFNTKDVLFQKRHSFVESAVSKGHDDYTTQLYLLKVKAMDMSTHSAPIYWLGGPYWPYLSIDLAFPTVKYLVLASTIHVIHFPTLSPAYFKAI